MAFIPLDQANYGDGLQVTTDVFNENFSQIQWLIGGQLEGNNLANQTIVAENIKDQEIINAKIADASITTAKIVDAAITSAKIGAAEVGSANIADAAINTAHIANAAITNAQIASLAVASANIQDAAITNAKIDRVSADKLVVTDADIQSFTFNKGQGGTLTLGGLNSVNGILSIKNGSGGEIIRGDESGVSVVSGDFKTILKPGGIFATAPLMQVDGANFNPNQGSNNYFIKSMTVKNSDGSITYTENTDYLYGRLTGEILKVKGSTMPSVGLQLIYTVYNNGVEVGYVETGKDFVVTERTAAIIRDDAIIDATFVKNLIVGNANITDLTADKIKGGELSVGGINNISGTISIKDGGGSAIVTIDNGGITADNISLSPWGASLFGVEFNDFSAMVSEQTGQAYTTSTMYLPNTFTMKAWAASPTDSITIQAGEIRITGPFGGADDTSRLYVNSLASNNFPDGIRVYSPIKGSDTDLWTTGGWRKSLVIEQKSAEMLIFSKNGLASATKTIGIGRTNNDILYFAASSAEDSSQPPVYPMTLNMVTGDLSLNVGKITQEAWSNPTLTNNWVSFSTAFYSPQYMKDSMGFVHLRGRVMNGTMSTNIFTLPAGYRPSKNILFAVDSNSAYGRVQIAATGGVAPVTGTNASISLDGIIFYADA